MKKLILVLCLLPVLLFCGCTDAKKIAELINSNATFELGFLEDVSEKDLSSLVPDYGSFGSDVYYNSGYSEGDIHYVCYVVRAYPDYADGGKVVTQIVCTDPAVTFFGGYTVNDSEELFEYLAGEGFKITGEYSGTFVQAKKDKFIITFSDDEEYKVMNFYYRVSNRNGIIF